MFTQVAPLLTSHQMLGIYSSIFSFHVPVGKHRTAFDGEVTALNVAQKQLIPRHLYKKVVILSDSKAAIQAIASKKMPISKNIQDSRALLEKLKIDGRQVTLQWIPGHCNIYGNEQADMLAKKGTKIIQQPNSNRSFHSTKFYIKNLMWKNWKVALSSRISLKSWVNILDRDISDRPREKTAVEFRLTVGHDCLAHHLHRIGIFTSPNCPLCRKFELIDRKHLMGCSAVRGDSEVKRYWSARLLLMSH
ncbi:uncharacterized protein [Parasteatoda tepidariorum]|uniref:uncharacterized protein n=1 Tax=Parasteatoda tepidariorum TaxID=114398 RepID=UPI0039BD635A